jgi:hypothetical protein
MEPEGSLPCSRESPPLDCIQSHVNPVRIFTLCFIKINFNIILTSTYRSPKWSVHVFRLEVHMYFSSPHASYIPCSYHPCFDLRRNAWWVRNCLNNVGWLNGWLCRSDGWSRKFIQNFRDLHGGLWWRLTDNIKSDLKETGFGVGYVLHYFLPPVEK